MAGPRLQGIFQQMIEGDQALLELARRRFTEAGLGAELYPNSPIELRSLHGRRPLPDRPYTAHLPRDIRLLEDRGHDRIAAFTAAADGAAGLVVHDQPEVAGRFDDVVAACRRLDARLQEHGPGPRVFIEYAAGLDPAAFVALFEALRDCPRLSACVDISHLGIRRCQVVYGERHPGADVCRLRPDAAELRQHAGDVQAACAAALPAVLDVVAALGRIGKPLHFHLHDGHPSSPFSPYGVSDHLSFFQEVPVPFRHRGRYALPPLFGPLGLRRVVAAARAALPDDALSFTLEIHPPAGARPLGPEDADLFAHWQDRTNAERMQHWLDVLLQNHQLLQDACAG